MSSSSQTPPRSWPPSLQPQMGARITMDEMIQQNDPRAIYIAVMGMTGSGKSTFIAQATRAKPGPSIGHGLERGTTQCEVFSMQRKGHTVYLIDTPGYDDLVFTDVSVLQNLAYSLSTLFRSGKKLSGILYLHRISDNRMISTAQRNLQLLRDLVGTDSFGCIVLLSTRWDTVDKKIAVAREADLMNRFWVDLMRSGSQVFRHDDTTESALVVLDGILEKQQLFTLGIQRELVHQVKAIIETTAGQELASDLIKELEILRSRRTNSTLAERSAQKRISKIREALNELELKNQQWTPQHEAALPAKADDLKKEALGNLRHGDLALYQDTLRTFHNQIVSKQSEQKAILSKALQRADSAILLDDAQNFEGAIDAYSEACSLLDQMMVLSFGEDRRKLEIINNTYMNRIIELKEIARDLNSDGKAFRQEPKMDQGPPKRVEEGLSTDTGASHQIYVTDLDVQTMARADSFHKSTETEVFDGELGHFPTATMTTVEGAIDNKEAEQQDSLPQVDSVNVHRTSSHEMALLAPLLKIIIKFILKLVPGMAVPPHILRLRWSCRCGYSSYDDFSELTSEAVCEMANELLESGYVTTASIDGHVASVLQSFKITVANMALTWRNIISHLQRTPRLPTTGPSLATSNTMHQPKDQCRFLHICVEKGRYSTRLHHIDMCDMTSDRLLFDALRRSYAQLRSQMNGILFRVRQIDFVEFQIYPKALVDSLVPGRIPPPHNTEYEHHNVGSSTMQPIGPKFMMHMWRCREEVPDKKFFIKRFPLKKSTPCTFNWDGDSNSNIGWGLHFAEALNISLLVWSLFIFTAIAGAVFGIFWTLLKDDISGAFTVASYITALMTLLLMAIMSVIAGA